jgi:hypothetical protein
MTRPAGDEWAAQLSGLIAGALDVFRGEVKDRIEIFAVDCHPWNGVLDLALLTQAEAANDPLLCDPTEMAAWRSYHFASGLACWSPASELARQMQEAYDESGEDRAATAESYLRACARAVATEGVQRSLSRYEVSEAFRICVRHPDNEAEFYPTREAHPKNATDRPGAV